MSGNALASDDRRCEAPTSADEAAVEFIYFTKLPAELRTRIWSFAARITNIIELKVERYPIYRGSKSRWEINKSTKHGTFTFGFKMYSPSPPRGVLFACKESHCESLKSGPRYFKLKNMNKPIKIYYFPSIDTISMDSLSNLALFHPGMHRVLKGTGFHKIQSLLLPGGFLCTAYLQNLVRRHFSTIKEVTVGFYEPVSSSKLEMKQELAVCLNNQLKEKYPRSVGGLPARRLQDCMEYEVYNFLAFAPPPPDIPGADNSFLYCGTVMKVLPQAQEPA